MQDFSRERYGPEVKFRLVKLADDADWLLRQSPVIDGAF